MCKVQAVSDQYVRSVLLKRPQNAHKGDCGKIFVIAGSGAYCGAAVLCCNGALKMGAGLVTFGGIKSVADAVSANIPEVVYLLLKEDNGTIAMENINIVLEKAKQCDSVVVGCGLKKNRSTISLVTNLITACKKPMVIDADAINVVAENIRVLKHKKAPIIITPHEMEFSRLSGLDLEIVKNNRAELAQKFSQEYDVTVVLKGHETIVANESTVFKNSTGNPGMATGGSGDVLAGMIGTLLAQGASAINAGAASTYLHGLAGDIAAEEIGEEAMLPSDTVNYIAKALKKLSNNCI